MKIAYKKQAEEHHNSNNCLAIEYPLDDEDINSAIIHLDGRYPDKGQVVNKECKEIAYIMEGKVKLVLEGKEVNLSQGDMVLIEPGEKYYWKGKAKMFVPCTPAWHPGQYEEIK